MGLPSPVKLFTGILSRFPDAVEEAVQKLQGRFGPVDRRFGPHAWTYTRYYEPAMGPQLQRWFAAFEPLVSPDELAAVKRWTIELEAEAARSGRWPVARPINLDPGYVDASKLVLASTKDRAQRVHVGGGIYAEVTLAVIGGKFTPHALTFPDFRSGAYDAYFEAVRDALLKQRGEGNGGARTDP